MAWSNWINVPDVSGVTAGAGDVLSGKVIVDKNGSAVTGTMANKSVTTVEASAVSSDSSYTYLTIPASGYYDTNSKIKTANSNVNKIKLISVSSYVGSDGDGTYRYTFSLGNSTKFRLRKSGDTVPRCALAWGSNTTPKGNLTEILFFNSDTDANASTTISSVAIDTVYNIPSGAKYAVLKQSSFNGSKTSMTYLESAD